MGPRGWGRAGAVAGVALLLLAAFAAIGPASRRFAPAPLLIHCARPAEFLRAWREVGVRGRTLVNVVRRIAMDPDPAREDDGYVLRALEEGLVRRVYHVLSDSAWAEVSRTLGGSPAARFDGRRFHLREDGNEIVVLRLQDLPPLGEPVLVAVDLDAYPESEVAALAELLARERPAADVLTWVGARTSPALEALRGSPR